MQRAFPELKSNGAFRRGAQGVFRAVAPAMPVNHNFKTVKHPFGFDKRDAVVDFSPFRRAALKALSAARFDPIAVQRDPNSVQCDRNTGERNRNTGKRDRVAGERNRMPGKCDPMSGECDRNAVKCNRKPVQAYPNAVQIARFVVQRE